MSDKRRESSEEAAKNSPIRRPSPYDDRTSARSGLEFRILGPLEVRRGEQALPLGSPKQRMLLAFLLLHANELVVREQLIEELWGDAAPPTVNAVLNGYLTKLRRLLANGDGERVLVTRAPGYVLHTGTAGRDADRFEHLIEDARAALARGDAADAAAGFREALALWRGAPLADVSDADFAQPEIRRLEELRLTALEERIDADLMLGRHETLVAELERLTAEHPYRERLHAQLMLALYRSGRQADALAGYQTTRRALVADLGIEPGRRLHELERAILQHDPALEPPAAEPPAPAPAPVPEAWLRRRARPRWLLAAASGLAVAIVLTPAGSYALHGASTNPPKPIALVGNSVAVIDAETNAIVGEIPVGGIPGGIAVRAGSVWVGNQEDNTLLRIDSESRQVQKTIALGTQPLDVAVNAGAIWVLSAAADSVLRVDPIRDQVVNRIRLDRWVPYESHLAPAGRFVYVAHGGALSRVDPATNTATTVRDANVLWIAADENLLWVVSRGRDGAGNVVDGIAPAQFRVLAHFRLAGVAPDLDGIAAEAGSVWTAGSWDTRLSKVNPMTGRVTGSVPVGGGVGGVAFGEGALWIIGKMETILRVDPRSGRVVKTISLGVPVAGMSGSASGPLAVGDGAVWIATRQP